MKIANATTGTRRDFVEGAVAAAVGIPSIAGRLAVPDTGSALRGSGGEGAPLNVLYLHSHDSGRYLQPYGTGVPTPALQKLAEEGVLFRQAFNAAPTCSPSRACLLSGQYAHANGMMGLAHRGFTMLDYDKTLFRTLQKAGYSAVLAGLQHIAPKPDMLGYDKVLAHPSTSAVHVAPAAVEWLNTKPKGPFFLDVGFFETHRSEAGHPSGYPDPTEQDDARYVMPPAVLPDTAETRRDMAGYHACARVLDAGVAAVLEALKANGFAENTLVISTTDHGIPFPTMKCNLNDNGMGVSLIVRGPGGFSGGKVCNAMVTHLDLFPTVCELAGVPKPEWLQGKSLLPVLRGEQEQMHEEIFAEVNYHAAYEPKRAARTLRWKYVRRYDGRRTAVLPNCDDGPSKNLWLANGWQKEPIEVEEGLYDLMFDPAERNNLVGSSLHKDALREMRGRLDGWMRRTDDPILKGPIPLPRGAITTNVDAVTYKDKSATITGS